jgi:hypothetical protein
MENKHYTDDELIGRLYGLDRGDGHLDLCGECKARLAEMKQRQSLATSHEPRLTPGFLAEQRHAVWARIEKPAAPHLFWRTASAFAGMAVLVIAFLAYHPTPNAPAPQPSASVAASVSDEELYADISTVVNTPEPLAATPIRGLFEEKETGKVAQ